LLRGWGTYTDNDAQSWMIALNDHKRFFGQQLRWRRNPIRLFMWVLRTLPTQIKNMNPMAIFAITLPTLATVCVLFRLITSLLTYPLMWVSPVILVFDLALSFFVLLIIRHKHPDQYVVKWIKLVLYSGWWVVNLFYLIILSMFTLDQDDWGHR
jgi:hypothetical protein